MILIALMTPQAVISDDTILVDEYDLDLRVDVENNVIYGTEEVIYHNKGSTDLDEIYFYIYANAFNDISSVPVDDIETTYPNGFDPGFIDIEVSKYDYVVEDDIYLKILLDEPLKSGDSITLYLDFEMKVPNTLNRFGYYEDVIYAANCFPIAAVNENGTWALYPYDSRGDPFYSESANWDVDINIRKEWNIATSGTIVMKYDNGEYYEYEIEAPMTRDFAFACSPRYKSVSEYYNDIEVISYYLEGHQQGGNLALDYAIESIQLFEELFGAYPYDTYTLAETYLGVGAGMEYPQLSFIDSDYYDRYDDTLFQVIVVHETAHQWWYSAVGNDEYMDSFIDESLAQYSTTIYFRELYEDEGDVYYDDFIFDYYRDDVPLMTNILDLPLDEYVSDLEYYMMVYIKGAVVLDMMSTYVGYDEFTGFLSGLYEKYLYGIITKDIIINELEEEFPNSNAGDVFDIFVSTDQMPDALPGGSFYYEDGEYDIKVDYSNELEIPVEIMIIYEDGTSELIGPVTMYSGKNGGTISSFEIDPRDLLVESNEVNNIGTLEFKEEEDINKTNYAYYVIAAIVVVVVAIYLYKKRYE